MFSVLPQILETILEKKFRLNKADKSTPIEKNEITILGADLSVHLWHYILERQASGSFHL